MDRKPNWKEVQILYLEAKEEHKRLERFFEHQASEEYKSIHGYYRKRAHDVSKYPEILRSKQKLIYILFQPRSPLPINESPWWTFLGCLKEIYPQIDINIRYQLYIAYRYMMKKYEQCPVNCSCQPNTEWGFCHLSRIEWVSQHMKEYHGIDMFDHKDHTNCKNFEITS